MKRLLRIIAAAILGAGLVGGVAGASSAVIDTTGPDSTNKVEFKDDVDVDIKAENKTEGSVEVDQYAGTGNAKVYRNTNAGDAETGDAENESDVEVEVVSSNTGVSAWNNWGVGGTTNHTARVENTGPDSRNEIEFDNDYDLDVRVENKTELYVNTNQKAKSGNAEVSRNTNGGGASTGNASNSSTTTVQISNN